MSALTLDERAAGGIAWWRRIPRDFLLMLAIIAGVLAFQHGATFRDISVPLRYEGDSLSFALIFKGVIEGGWFPGYNPLLGAPFGAELLDYPMSEGANLLLVYVLGFFGDWGFVTNAYLLLSYFLVAAAAYWVLRKFGLKGPWPAAGALLFTFLPYHPLRAAHIFLAAYYPIPLGVWLAWTVWRAPESNADRRATWISSLAAGSGGMYYAFFACYLIVVAMLAAAAANRRSPALKRGLFVLVLVTGTVVLNVMPTIAYRVTHGKNPEVAVRPYADTERFAFKPIQLVLPRPEHRIEPASRLLLRYIEAAGTEPNESVTSSLGLVGTIGFFLLLWWILRALAMRAPPGGLAGYLAASNLACLLLGTLGGFGAMFSFLVSATARSYNRISVVIAFVAIAAVLKVLADAIERRRRAADTARRAPVSFLEAPVAAWIAAAVLVAVGIFDQTSGSDLKPIRGAYDSDRAFVKEMEARLRSGAMVYQMPYHRYPEAGNQFELENYGPARGYLHSAALRWSYGHMKGRAGDRWMMALKQQPVARQMEIIAESGFEAVMLDRRGYKDRGKSVEAELRTLLGPPLAQSADAMLVAFAVRPTGRTPVAYDRLFAAFDAIDFAADLPPTVERLAGFSGREPWGRWTEGPVAQIDLARPLPREFVLNIHSVMALHPNVGRPFVVRIGNVERTFTVTPRETKVDLPFVTDGTARSIVIRIPNPVSPAEIGMSGDPRKLGLGMKSLSVRSP